MNKYIYWDVDTQYDFMNSRGKLYVPGAEEIIPNLKQLFKTAHHKGIKILGSVDYHGPHDEELSDHPDFLDTFPPHCLIDTQGQSKIEATNPKNPLWINCQPYPAAELNEMLAVHEGEIYFRKRKFDVFSNPNTIPVLDNIKPHRIVLFGVALDVCNAHAIEGLLKLGKYQIYLVTDAVKSINPAKGNKLLKQWESRGVLLISTDGMVKELNYV